MKEKGCLTITAFLQTSGHHQNRNMLNPPLNGRVVLVLGSNVDFHARMGDPRETAPDCVELAKGFRRPAKITTA
jgi:hypothetical protein